MELVKDAPLRVDADCTCVVSQPLAPLPPAIHLHASSPARAESLLAALLEHTLIRSSKLDPLQVPNVHSAFERLVADLGPAGASQLKPQQDDLDLALDSLRRVLADPYATAPPTVIVVQRAERMRDVWTESLSDAFWRLAELVSWSSQGIADYTDARLIRHALRTSAWTAR